MVAEITPSTLDENLGTSAAKHTGSKNSLNDKHISPIQEALQSPNTLKKEFMRNTERMQFVISCSVWKVLFKEKENWKNELAKLVRQKERETQKK